MSIFSRIKALFVKAPAPQAPRFFTPAVEFFCPDLQSAYAPGLEYTAQPQDQLLRNKLDTWVSEGKVIELTRRSNAFLTGRY